LGETAGEHSGTIRRKATTNGRKTRIIISRVVVAALIPSLYNIRYDIAELHVSKHTTAFSRVLSF